MAKISKRRGNRFSTSGDDQIAIYFRGTRIEGRVIDQTERGLGIICPSDCGLNERQNVQYIYRRCRGHATVANTSCVDEGLRIGLKLPGG